MLRDSLANTAVAPSLTSSFERNVNTYTWDLGGYWAVSSGRWMIRTSERFQRALIKTDRESVKDEQTFSTFAEHRVSSALSIAGSMSSYVFSDNRTLALHSLTSNKVLGGVVWTPSSGSFLSPMLGYSLDNQQGTLDAGPVYSGSAGIRDLRIGDTKIMAEGYLLSEHISPRLQQEYRIGSDFASEFGNLAHNQGNVSFRKIRRDYYLAAENTGVGTSPPIESRIESSYSILDRLEYQLSHPFSLIAGIDASQRFIEKRTKNPSLDAASRTFGTDIEEFRLTGSGTIRYRGIDGTRGDVRLEVNERTESHNLLAADGGTDVEYARQTRLEEQKNNTISQTMLSVYLSYPAGRRDTISATGSSVKLAYNTPSTSNFDDRDDLFLVGGMRWIHRFSPLFTASVAGDINLRHTVYVFAERSANNTWNRIIRFVPSTEYRNGSRFYSKNTAEIIANYTVYDFESSAPAQRSFSLRQILLTDSSTYNIGPMTTLQLSLQVRMHEQGEIRWAAFTVRPLAFHDERGVTGSISHSIDRMTGMIGFRYLSLSRYSYRNTEKRFENRTVSYGPICRAQAQLSNGTGVLIDGWYQIVDGSSVSPKATPNVSLQVIWNL